MFRTPIPTEQTEKTVEPRFILDWFLTPKRHHSFSPIKTIVRLNNQTKIDGNGGLSRNIAGALKNLKASAGKNRADIYSTNRFDLRKLSDKTKRA